MKTPFLLVLILVFGTAHVAADVLMMKSGTVYPTVLVQSYRQTANGSLFLIRHVNGESVAPELTEVDASMVSAIEFRELWDSNPRPEGRIANVQMANNSVVENVPMELYNTSAGYERFVVRNPGTPTRGDVRDLQRSEIVAIEFFPFRPDPDSPGSHAASIRTPDANVESLTVPTPTPVPIDQLESDSEADPDSPEAAALLRVTELEDRLEKQEIARERVDRYRRIVPRFVRIIVGGLFLAFLGGLILKAAAYVFSVTEYPFHKAMATAVILCPAALIAFQMGMLIPVPLIDTMFGIAFAISVSQVIIQGMMEIEGFKAFGVVVLLWGGLVLFIFLAMAGAGADAMSGLM